MSGVLQSICARAVPFGSLRKQFFFFNFYFPTSTQCNTSVRHYARHVYYFLSLQYSLFYIIYASTLPTYDRRIDITRSYILEVRKLYESYDTYHFNHLFKILLMILIIISRLKQLLSCLQLQMS